MDLGPLVLGPASGPLDRATAEDWSLVLAARRVPHRMLRSGAGYGLRTTPWFADRAAGEIRLYIEENPPGAGASRVPPRSGPDARLALLAALFLPAFYGLTNRPMPGLGLFPHHWTEAGAADAGAIIAGQWWRAATALTLHGDLAHVLGNAVIGGVFLVLVAKRLGPGLGWLLTLAAGVLGNLVNSYLQGPPHLSLGFSTAVFGAAGILSGVRAMDGEGLSPRSFLVPVAAGLGLLAMLGSGEGNVDLGAHVCGFFCGLPMGALAVAVAGRLARVLARADAWLFLAGFGVIAWAWVLAYAD